MACGDSRMFLLNIIQSRVCSDECSLHDIGVLQRHHFFLSQGGGNAEENGSVANPEMGLHIYSGVGVYCTHKATTYQPTQQFYGGAHKNLGKRRIIRSSLCLPARTHLLRYTRYVGV